MKPDHDYEVGYASPPRETRFCKGRSGNPAGRPKGSKNLSTLLGSTLNERVVVTENGRRKKITKRQAVLKQLVNKAASGDPRSTQLLLAEMRTIDANAPATRANEPPLDDSERRVLGTLIQRFQAMNQEETPGGDGDA